MRLKDIIEIIFYILKEVIRLTLFIADEDIKVYGTVQPSTVIAISLVLLTIAIHLTSLTVVAYISFASLL